MAAVSAISFSLFNFVGDPVNNMVGQDATREQRVEIRQQLGLDDPVLTQYTRFIGNVCRVILACPTVSNALSAR